VALDQLPGDQVDINIMIIPGSGSSSMTKRWDLGMLTRYDSFAYLHIAPNLQRVAIHARSWLAHRNGYRI